MNNAINADPVIVEATHKYTQFIERFGGARTRDEAIRQAWIESTIAWAQLIYENRGAQAAERAMFDHVLRGRYHTGEFIPFHTCKFWLAEVEARKKKNAEIRAM